jgi:putative ABC transport system ATP-binding protein
MLQMKNVSKIYRTDTVETHALREFSLSVEEGEFVSVTGPSGSGKTTFLNIAGLLEELTSGTYELDGRDISSLNDKERSRVRNEKIGFIFQSRSWMFSIMSTCRCATADIRQPSDGAESSVASTWSGSRRA